MRRALLLALVMTAGLLVAGCNYFGSTPQETTGFDTPAQVLANEAETLYQEGDYSEAAEYYQQIKDRFPYSRYSLLADLRVGDAYYKAGRTDEAVLAYDDFIRLHPKNEAVPYAIYQMGMVYHSQMLSRDRDPSSARKAVETFRRLGKDYPKSEWTQKAQPRLVEALEHMAGHDFYVGVFYYRTNHFEAAIGRFKRVLTEYPDVGLYGQAMDYIRKSEQAIAELSPEERKGLTGPGASATYSRA